MDSRGKRLPYSVFHNSIEWSKGHSTLLCPVDAAAAAWFEARARRMRSRVLVEPIVREWCAAAGSPRRASSTSFERRAAHVQDETWKDGTARRRAREGTAAPGATGLRTAWKRTKSPAAPRSCRCPRDACGCFFENKMLADVARTLAALRRRGWRQAAGWRGLRACASEAEGWRGPQSPIQVNHDRTCPI